MFTWLRKKIIKGFIKDLLKEIPSMKAKAISYFEVYHDEILEKVLLAIKKAVLDFIQEKH